MVPPAGLRGDSHWIPVFTRATDFPRCPAIAPAPFAHTKPTGLSILTTRTLPAVFLSPIPKLTIPKLTIPKLTVPKLTVPKLAVPRLAVPKLTAPRLAVRSGLF